VIQAGRPGSWLAGGAYCHNTRNTASQRAITRKSSIPDKQEKLERLQKCLEAGADIAWLSGGSVEDVEQHRQEAVVGCAATQPDAKGVPGRGRESRRAPGHPADRGADGTDVDAGGAEKTGTAQAFLAKQPHIEEMTKFYNQQGADELKRIESTYGGAG